MTRAVLLAATLAALLCMWADSPPPKPLTWLESLTPKVTQVDYCNVDTKVAGQDEHGVWHFGWSKMYAPCWLQDEYRNI